MPNLRQDDERRENRQLFFTGIETWRRESGSSCADARGHGERGHEPLEVCFGPGCRCCYSIGGGCSETLPLTQLPDVTKLPEKVLNKDEQQGKVNEMITKGQQHQTEAAKDIENGK